MFMEYWGVGATTKSTLPMTVDNVSSHLIADWIPALPAAIGSSFIGWPPYLIEVIKFEGRDLLTLRRETGRTERQWKGVLSWMLGIAGTRQVLASEQYRWVAPLSAFYPEALHEVDLSQWHPAFPRSSIQITSRPGSPSRLRPDYLALRSTVGTFECAVVESKGTERCLTSMSNCPDEWSNQARNAFVVVNDVEITIPRHLVVASRVNPNARRSSTRRIQVRAWNRLDAAQPTLPLDAVIDVVAAHLFGLFRGLLLPQNALAIALSVKARSKPSKLTGVGNNEAAFRRAEGELQQIARPTETQEGGRAWMVPMRTEFGTVEVVIAEPVIDLARDLQRHVSADEAVTSLRRADSLLDKWETSRKEESRDRKNVLLPFGIEVRFPQDYGAR